MALKTFKPYTKSTRGTILVDRAGLWKGKPFKSLVSPKNSMKGRNNNGHITSINRAGGHKKMYRHVDFYRKKFDMPATVERIEYDPNRSCYIMLVKFEDNSHSYYLAPQKIKVGDKIENGAKKEIKVGNCMPLQDIPVGINIHNIEIQPGGGGIAHGPKGELSYKKRKLNKSEKKNSIASLISEKIKSKNLLVFNDFTNEIKKTKEMSMILKKFEILNSLIILDKASKIKIEKSIRNIPNVKVTDINHFSAFDIVKFKKVVFTESSVKELEKRYS